MMHRMSDETTCGLTPQFGTQSPRGESQTAVTSHYSVTSRSELTVAQLKRITSRLAA